LRASSSCRLRSFSWSFSNSWLRRRCGWRSGLSSSLLYSLSSTILKSLLLTFFGFLFSFFGSSGCFFGFFFGFCGFSSFGSGGSFRSLLCSKNLSFVLGSPGSLLLFGFFSSTSIFSSLLNLKSFFLSPCSFLFFFKFGFGSCLRKG